MDIVARMPLQGTTRIGISAVGGAQVGLGALGVAVLDVCAAGHAGPRVRLAGVVALQAVGHERDECDEDQGFHGKKFALIYFPPTVAGQPLCDKILPRRLKR
jgi:hypothetical protein